MSILFDKRSSFITYFSDCQSNLIKLTYLIKLLLSFSFFFFIALYHINTVIYTALKKRFIYIIKCVICNNFEGEYKKIENF